jgi:hypothetical protein
VNDAGNAEVRMGDPLEEYLAIYDDAAGRMFVALDAAIRQAAPELDVAIKYRLLSYTVDQDWRHWGTALLQGLAASVRVA